MWGKITQWLESERSRWVLWLPVLLGLGMGLYFALPFEPHPLSLLPVAGLVAPWHYARRRGWSASLPLGVVLLILAGLVWAKGMNDWRETTLLHKELRFAPIEGRIIEISDVQGGYRLTLDKVQVETLPPHETPQRVRLKLQGKTAGEGLKTGDQIALRGGLLPPSGPVMPEAFDFARFFYYRGIGGVGYGIPPVTKQAETESHDLFLTRWRAQLTQRIRSHMSPTEGTIAAALMTGERAAIPDAANEAMRITNLSHLLSISGMHMAIVTGLVFISIRYGLLWLPLTQHWRYAKQAAAWVALVGSGFYLLISGLPVSAVRAYIMVALMLIAILIHREVMPVRSIAWAAVILLLFDPSNLLEPSFQLSFGATLALIVWYEYVRDTSHTPLFESSRFRRLILYIAGVLMTSFVAEIATLPLVLYHFNNMSFMGMLANGLVMPLVSFVMMPAVVLAFVAMPFRLEYWPLQAAEWSIYWMLLIAERIAELPYASIYAIAPPTWGVALMTLGALWLMLWKRRQRLLGLLFIAVGALSIMTIRTPDLLISKDAKQLAYRMDGELTLLKGRPESFVPQQWAFRSGVNALPVLKEGGDAFRCDRVGCIIKDKDVTIAWVREQAALAEDCKHADVVIAPFIVWSRECSAPLVIDRRRLQAEGGMWLWREGSRWKMGSSAQEQGRRPWSD